MMMLEDCDKSRSPVKETCHNFPMFPEFQRASYSERYNLLCRKLVKEQLYTAAALMLSPRSGLKTGEYADLSELTSVRTFFAFTGGGGQFSGGGASGGFDDMGAIITEGPGNAFAETAGSAGGSIFDGTGSALADHGGSALGDTVGDVAGEAVGALGEEEGLVGIVVLAVIGAVVAIVLGAGVYIIYEAPFILSEAAFEVVLATSLVRSSRTINEPAWIGSVFRTTWIPFGLSLVIAWIGATVIHSYYPEVTRISELLRQLSH